MDKMSQTRKGGARYPQQIILGAAAQWFMRHLKANPDFAREREAIYQCYNSTIESLFSSLGKLLEERENKGPTGHDRTELEAQVKTNLNANEYINEITELCLRYHVDYRWTPGILFYEDLQRVLGLNMDNDPLFIQFMLSVFTGLPPVVQVALPSYLVHMGKRNDIHTFVDASLDNIPREDSWRDVPHSLERHTKWLYNHKVEGKSYVDILNDSELTPDSYLASEYQVGRAVRRLDRFLGGLPGRKGRPKNTAGIT